MNLIKLFKVSLFSSVLLLLSQNTDVSAATLVNADFNKSLGNTSIDKENNANISTIWPAKDINLLSKSLEIDLKGLGIEGSQISYSTGKGDKYAMTWQLYTQERDGDDAFYLWNGLTTTKIATSTIATNRLDRWYWQSNWITTEFYSPGEFALIVLDTRDRAGETGIRIKRVEALPEPSAIVGILTIGLMMRKRSPK